jgi:hypothetical protein
MNVSKAKSDLFIVLWAYYDLCVPGVAGKFISERAKCSLQKVALFRINLIYKDLAWSTDISRLYFLCISHR